MLRNSKNKTDFVAFYSSLPDFVNVDLLQKKKVFVAGAGGVGNFITYFLTSVGIGHIYIADFDKIEISNLNRQFLYNINDIGKYKVFVLSNKLSNVNPNTNIFPINQKLTKENIKYIIPKGIELIIDCVDNWETKLLLNEYSVKSKIPLAHLGVSGCKGQTAIFNTSNTSPCLQCVYEAFDDILANEIDENISHLSYSIAFVSSILVSEIVNLFLKKETKLTTKIILTNIERLEIKEIPINKRDDCPVCSKFSKNKVFFH